MRQTYLFCLTAVCVLQPTVTEADYIVNGDFASGSTGWTVVQEGSGVITFPPEHLSVVGADGGPEGPATNGAYQAVAAAPGKSLMLSFDLLSYMSDDDDADSAYMDVPYVAIDGTTYLLNADGTIDWSTYWQADLGYGWGGWVGGDGRPDVNNLNESYGASYSPTRIIGTGPITVEFGVFSADSIFGAGTALFDNVSVLVVPEPSSLALLGIGVACVALVRRRRRPRTLIWGRTLN